MTCGPALAQHLSLVERLRGNMGKASVAVRRPLLRVSIAIGDESSCLMKC